MNRKISFDVDHTIVQTDIFGCVGVIVSYIVSATNKENCTCPLHVVWSMHVLCLMPFWFLSI